MNSIQVIFFISICWTASEARFRQSYESPERSIERRDPRDYYSSYHKPHHVTDNPVDDSRYPRPRARVNEPDESHVNSRYSPRPRPRVSRHHYNPRDRPLNSREHRESFETKRYRRPENEPSRREIGPRSPSTYPLPDHNRQRSDFSDKSSRGDKLQLQKTAFEKLNRLDKDARKNLHKTIAKLAKVNDAIKANVEKIPKIVKKTCAMRKAAENPSNGNNVNANEKILIFKRDTKSSSKSSTEESSSFDVSSSESKSKSKSESSDSISLSSFSQSAESAYSDISGDLLLTDSASNSRVTGRSSRRYTRPQRARAPPRTYPSRYSRELYDHHRSLEHHHVSRYHHSASY